jgi:hypothetical protein
MTTHQHANAAVDDIVSEWRIRGVLHLDRIVRAACEASAAEARAESRAVLVAISNAAHRALATGIDGPSTPAQSAIAEIVHMIADYDAGLGVLEAEEPELQRRIDETIRRYGITPIAASGNPLDRIVGQVSAALSDQQELLAQQAAVAAEYDSARRELWRQAEEARGEVARLLAQRRTVAQLLIESIGATGPESLEETALRAAEWLDVARLREALREALAATEREP